eukprot:10601405-Prorocentrum_lima.AAC.1
MAWVTFAIQWVCPCCCAEGLDWAAAGPPGSWVGLAAGVMGPGAGRTLCLSILLAIPCMPCIQMLAGAVLCSWGVL